LSFPFLSPGFLELFAAALSRTRRRVNGRPAPPAFGGRVARSPSKFRVTRRLIRPAFPVCVFDETNSERKYIMEIDDNDLCGMEALDILRPASDYLLQMATAGRIDLNRLARLELRARRRYEATQQIAVMARRAP